MEFKRFGRFVADIGRMNLMDTAEGTVYKFDFDNMVCTKVTHQSAPRYPIRYDVKTSYMMVWKQRRWQKMEIGSDAIDYMFQTSIEKSILD